MMQAAKNLLKDIKPKLILFVEKFTKKRIIFSSIVVGALLLLVVVFVVMSKTQENTRTIQFTPTPTPIFSLNPQSPNGVGSTLQSSIVYSGNDKLEQIVDNKHSLPKDQETIKQNLINESLPNEDYQLLSTSDFTVNYIQAFDEFQVEISIVDYEKAKNEAITYFRNQGLSNDSICNLPLSFSLSYDVAQQLEGKNISFNVLPDFCK